MQGFDPNGPQFQDAGLPVPPAPQPTMPTPGQSGLTLGQANPQAPPVSGPEANPYLQHYQQALEAAHVMTAGAKRDYLPPQTAPGMMANILTMGLAAATHEHYRKAFNVGVDEYNKQLELYASNLAREMMNDQAKGNDAEFSKRLKLLEAEVGIDRLHLSEANQQVKLNTPPTPGEQQGAEANDMEWQPGKGFQLKGNAQTGWTMGGPPAAPGSPAGQIAGGVLAGGGHAAAATPPTTGTDRPTKDPGETPAAFNDRLEVWKEQQKGDVAAQNKAKSDTATENTTLDRNAKLLESMFADPKYDMAVKQTLISGVGAGVMGPLRMYLQRVHGKGGPQYLQMQKTAIMPALRALEAGTKGMTLRGGQMLGKIGLADQFERIASGRASQEEATAFKQAVMDRVAKVREIQGAGPSSVPGVGSSSTKPTGGTLGTAPTSLEGLLKQHGY